MSSGRPRVAESSEDFDSHEAPPPVASECAERRLRAAPHDLVFSTPERKTGGVPSLWGTSPRASIEAECELRGRQAVINGCVEILKRLAVDDGLLMVLAGPAAQPILDGYQGGPDGYWPRVWALRGLLYVWDDAVAASSVVDSTMDEAWRVREMAAKVIARHGVGDGLEAVVRLQGDPVARVRKAATRATEVLVAELG